MSIPLTFDTERLIRGLAARIESGATDAEAFAAARLAPLTDAQVQLVWETADELRFYQATWEDALYLACRAYATACAARLLPAHLAPQIETEVPA